MSGTIGTGLPSANARTVDLQATAAQPRARTHAAASPSGSAAWAHRHLHAYRLTDLAIVITAVASSVAVGSWTGLAPWAPEESQAGIAAAFVLLWFGALRLRRTSELRIVGRSRELGRVVGASLAAFGILAMVSEFMDVDGLRAYLLVGLPLGAVLLVGGRTFWQRRLDTERARGLSLPRAVVVGAGPDINFVAEQLGRSSAPRYVVAAAVLSDGRPGDSADTAPSTIDTITAITDAVAMANADVVILASHPGDGGEFVRGLSWRLESSSAELVLAWCLDSVDRSRVRFDTVDGLPLMHVATPTFSGAKHRAKRALDIVLSGLALIFLAPFFAVIAVLIRRDSEGPVFFRQERVGVDGTRFSMVKFRSMATTAEADLAGLLEQNEGNGLLFKLRSDPRVTRVGAVLRRYSLDELPQLWNIFVGHMSIVGPRPPLVREAEQYDDRLQRRLYIKPGLTGAWQVGGRSDLSWEESIRLDLNYVENWSLLGDLLIMWRTIGVVIGPVGAY
ncbi:sugar transferase [Salinibacterium sp. CAN_S4]|uniref:sugar transferase n=1 Tax=Salinibacterium sp. CAN_S4 TaxID=2787727 RepID=UPI0018EFD8B2